MYQSLANLKAHLAITSSSDDDLLTFYLGAAQAAINAHCQRVFECEADSTRYFDADDAIDGAVLYFDEDLAQVTEIVDGDGVTMDGSTYRLLPQNDSPKYGAKNISDAWINGGDSAPIAITGRWAYSITAPADIQQAALRLAAWMYQQRGSYQSGAGAQVTESGLYVVPGGLPADVKELLARYVRVNT